MVYAPTVWQDGVTPVNAANLNKLEQGLAAAVGVPADVVVTPATAHLIRNRYAVGDTQPVFRLLADGKHEWGAGGATAPDTTLYRAGANVLRTDDTLQSMMDIVANVTGAGQIWLHPDGGIYFGSGADVRLYRTAAGSLAVQGNLTVTGVLEPVAGRLGQVASYPAGMDWNACLDNGWYMTSSPVNGPPGMTSWAIGEVLAHGAAGWRIQRVWDFTQAAGSQGWERRQTNGVWGSWFKVGTYIDGASHVHHPDDLYIDNNLIVGQNIYAGAGLVIDNAGAGSANKLYFGAALDTNLYRVAASSLKTDNSLTVGGTIYGLNPAVANFNTANQVALGYNGGNAPAISFGNPYDTNLYRFGAGYLKTDGGLLLNGGVYIDQDNDGSRLYFGSAQDTSLYRDAASVLRTDALFLANAGVKFSDGSVQTKAAASAGMVLLAEDVLGGTGWLTVSSIPQTYRHLRIEVMAKSATGSDGDRACMRLNGVGSGYFNRGGVMDSDIVDRAYIAWVTGNSGPSTNEWGTFVIEIPYYSQPNLRKSLLSRYIARCGFSGSGNDVRHGVQGAECTDLAAAITQIQCFSDTGSANGFLAGSRMSVYGIV